MLETKFNKKKKKKEWGWWRAGREEREAAAAEHRTPNQDLPSITIRNSVTIKSV